MIELIIVIALLGLFSALALPNLIQFMATAEARVGKNELATLQTAVYAMLVDAVVDELDGAFSEVDISTEIEAVTCRGGTYSLDEYLRLGDPNTPLLQSYDITVNGKVTVH